jgi:hypothetical protein
VLPVLYNSREFQHIPIRERRRAAWEARQRAMRHWQFWLAIAFLAGSTLLCRLIARHWFSDEPNGTIGAGIGFGLGMAWYGRTLFRIGMPHYRQILKEYESRQEPESHSVNAPSTADFKGR